MKESPTYFISWDRPSFARKIDVCSSNAQVWAGTMTPLTWPSTMQNASDRTDSKDPRRCQERRYSAISLNIWLSSWSNTWVGRAHDVGMFDGVVSSNRHPTNGSTQMVFPCGMRRSEPRRRKSSSAQAVNTRYGQKNLGARNCLRCFMFFSCVVFPWFSLLIC